jgi:hypothetical protein
MWPTWERERRRIEAALLYHSENVQHLPGIEPPSALEALSMQFVASLRRESYYELVQQKTVSAQRADPNHQSFDAERAVAFHIQQRNLEEAAWLIFLMTHFARPADTGWLRLKDVYGRLGAGIWDWQAVSADPRAFANWLAQHAHHIRGKFGNHRKYESLRNDSDRGTGRVVESYVNWVGADGHQRLFAEAVRAGGNNPHIIFDALYKKLTVLSFGRLAKFDYLSLIGRYRIAPIDAGAAYLTGATGPTRGARLLFDGDLDGRSTVRELQAKLDVLDVDLRVSMKVMEDALCNWQKSPTRFVHFKG